MKLTATRYGEGFIFSTDELLDEAQRQTILDVFRIHATNDARKIVLEGMDFEVVEEPESIVSRLVRIEAKLDALAEPDKRDWVSNYRPFKPFGA